MKTEESNTDADYIVSKDGKNIAINEAGSLVEDRYEAAKAAYGKLDCARAGAYMASIFVNMPWLDTMSVVLSAQAEYDDDGSCYRCIRVKDLTVTAGVDLPAEVVDSSGDLDYESACDLMREEVDEEGWVYYEAVTLSRFDYRSITIQMARSQIAHLLEGGPVSGKAAFVVLFPEYADHATA